jgi:predicted DNA-binding transcriptional regulator AlpA
LLFAGAFAPSTIASDITRNPAKLPPFIRLGRAIRFPVAEVEAWEKQQLTNTNFALI